MFMLMSDILMRGAPIVKVGLIVLKTVTTEIDRIA